MLNRIYDFYYNAFFISVNKYVNIVLTVTIYSILLMIARERKHKGALSFIITQIIIIVTTLGLLFIIDNAINSLLYWVYIVFAD